MNILQINCVYGQGSTGAITAALHEALLAEGHASTVLYGRGVAEPDALVIKVCGEPYAKANRLYSLLTGDRYGGCVFSTRKVIRYIEEHRPDLVHLQCVNGNFVNIYKLVDWLKMSGIPVVLTLHAEFMYTANCSHAVDCVGFQTGCGHCPRLKEAGRSIAPDRTAVFFERMRRAFEGFGDRITVVSVSPWLRDRAVLSPIMRELKHTVIQNGVDTGIFCPRPKEAFVTPNEKLVFHPTACFSDDPAHLKGGAEVIAIAKRFSGRPVRFLVAGKTHISGVLPDNITLLGELRDKDFMARLYSSADVTLLTSRRETFSMPVAESLCCGTPVVGYMAGGSEQIALPEYSVFTPWGETDELARSLENALDRSFDRGAVAAAAGKKYADRVMTDRYLALYGSMLCN